MSEINKATLQKFFQAQIDEYLSILESWVAINSFTANRQGVNALGVKTAQTFEQLGFSTERIRSENDNFGDHFILTRQGTETEKIGLVSHLDTVFPPQEEAENGFAWRPEGEKIYGPGTVDIKGGTLMIYMVLHALQTFQPGIFEATSWVILLDASEETLSEDFGQICKDRLSDAAACLIFEGGFFEGDAFKIVQKRKGMAKYRVVVQGKAAHAGSSHPEGANAIVQISELIGKIAGFTDYSKEITFNVGSVSGGTVPNRVPHYAELIGEMRAFDAEIFDEGVDKLLALKDEVTIFGGNGSSCVIDVDVYEITPPWTRNDQTDALLDIWRSVGVPLGYRLFPEARGGLSDGNHTWNVVPTVDGLGPSGGNAHCSEHEPSLGKEQEYLLLPSLIPKAIINVMAIEKLLKSR